MRYDEELGSKWFQKQKIINVSKRNELTRTAAIELGQHGITVNTICPNHVTTGLGAWQNQYFSAATGRSEEKYLADMRSRIPLGRPGLQEDIAKACAFLASEQAAYITGEAMNVSGGEEYH